MHRDSRLENIELPWEIMARRLGFRTCSAPRSHTHTHWHCLPTHIGTVFGLNTDRSQLCQCELEHYRQWQCELQLEDSASACSCSMLCSDCFSWPEYIPQVVTMIMSWFVNLSALEFGNTRRISWAHEKAEHVRLHVMSSWNCRTPSLNFMSSWNCRASSFGGQTVRESYMPRILVSIEDLLRASIPMKQKWHSN